ncbi:hypothetical protein HD554DRAFT_2326791 [Boletus coccyginus]|nr:hypothetical protein HD554DRAFT_2326791 [Boletus coccyginus]
MVWLAAHYHTPPPSIQSNPANQEGWYRAKLWIGVNLKYTHILIFWFRVDRQDTGTSQLEYMVKILAGPSKARGFYALSTAIGGPGIPRKETFVTAKLSIRVRVDRQKLARSLGWVGLHCLCMTWSLESTGTPSRMLVQPHDFSSVGQTQGRGHPADSEDSHAPPILNESLWVSDIHTATSYSSSPHSISRGAVPWPPKSEDGERTRSSLNSTKRLFRKLTHCTGMRDSASTRTSWELEEENTGTEGVEAIEFVHVYLCKPFAPLLELLSR